MHLPSFKSVGVKTVGVVQKWPKMTIFSNSRAVTLLKACQTCKQNPHAHLDLTSNASAKFQVNLIKTVGEVIRKWPKMTILNNLRAVTT